MINWLSEFIRKRGKIVFSILLVIIIIAFVFTIGAGPGLVKRDRTSFVRDFYGIDLNNPEDVQYLRDAQMVSHYVNGLGQYNEAQFQQQLFLRQVRLHLADTLSIPLPSDEEFVDYIKTKRAFQNESGEFDPTRFEQFVDSIKGGSRFDDSFVTHVIKEEYRMEQVDLLMSAPGFVSDSEVKKNTARDRTTWTVEIAKINYEDFDPEIDVSEEELTEYFASQQFRYEIPAELEATYVSFDTISIENSTLEVPEDTQLEQYFMSNRGAFSEAENALNEGKTEEEKLSPLDVFAAIKADVLNAYQEDQKGQQALIKAHDFIAALSEQDIAYGGEAFQKLLAANNVKLQKLPTFSENLTSSPSEDLPISLFQEVIKLDAERYFSDVVSSDDSHLVGFWTARKDARIPALEEVRERVVVSYKETRKSELFSEKGVELVSTINSKIAEEGGFKANAEALGLTVENPEAFTIATRPDTLPFQLIQQLETLKKGEISDMITLEEGGYIVYAADKVVPEIPDDDPQFVGAKQGMQNYSAFARYQAIITDMIDSKFATNQ
ncbi:MAG: hypothetical protein MI748_00010 [Opitutales bacterium]|nr:hypothetical protein [Opitutales bacterium]